MRNINSQMLPTFPVTHSIVHGKFTFCGNTESHGILNHVRIKEGPVKNFVKLQWEPKGCTHFNVKQKTHGFGIQHTVDQEQTEMFFQVDKYGYDTKDAPYYLYGNELKKTRGWASYAIIPKMQSKPLYFNIKVEGKGDLLTCAICLDSQDITTSTNLVCGHFFHNDCLLNWLDKRPQTNCWSCNRSHYMKKFPCPCCNQLSY